MRFYRFFLPTLKEAPSDAEVISHRLMVRAGMIRKVAAGIYNYLPLGLRVIHKVENIVREEMNMAGAQEVVMPMVIPSELWQESGRWDAYGKELLRIKDRHERDFCLGPTHEEVITDMVRKEVRSYRELPLNIYQIQPKFRDEIRPRFGLMRGREFIMKDAYSFHATEEDAEREYQNMYDTYCRIFERCGLKFRAVEAETGAIGGRFSHEFMVLADTGEDAVASCNKCSYAANVEKAEIRSQGSGVRGQQNTSLQIFADYSVQTIVNSITGANEADAHFINVNIDRDFTIDSFADLRIVTDGDLCPRCNGVLKIFRGIEVGHIFKLGTKYSEAMGATFLNEKGQGRPVIMGCYGIGIGRTAAASIEQNHDKNGIIWPVPLAPFHVHIVPVNVNDKATMDAAERVYKDLIDAGLEALMDDRDERAGIKFNDADLIGIPVRVTIGNKTLKENSVELKLRNSPDAALVRMDEVRSKVLEIVNSVSKRQSLRVSEQ